MNKPIVAHANTVINAPAARVWHALVTPDVIKKYMFGTNVTSDWKEGSRIVWRGEWRQSVRGQGREQAREHSEGNWGKMLNGLKSVLEQ